MEEAPENGKESSNSAYTNGMNEWMLMEGFVITDLVKHKMIFK